MIFGDACVPKDDDEDCYVVHAPAYCHKGIITEGRDSFSNNNHTSNVLQEAYNTTQYVNKTKEKRKDEEVDWKKTNIVKKGHYENEACANRVEQGEEKKKRGHINILRERECHN